LLSIHKIAFISIYRFCTICSYNINLTLCY